MSPLIFAAGILLAFGGKIFAFVSFLAALTLHETAHWHAAERRGYSLREINIGLLGAEMRGNASASLSDQVVIAAAGPLAGLAAGLICVGTWWLFPESCYITGQFALSNFALALFNALPAFPLDGGTVAYALLKKTRFNAALAVRISGGITAAGLTALFISAGMRNYSLLAAALFLAAHALKKRPCDGVFAKLYERAGRYEKLKRGLPVKAFVVCPESTVGRIKKLMSPDYYGVFVIAGKEGYLTESDFDFSASSQDKTPICQSEIYFKRKKCG